jgi:hypothetical protein
MSEKKRFQNQTLNSDDYKKTEDEAETLKDGITVAAILVLAVPALKKYGPKLLKGVASIFKA